MKRMISGILVAALVFGALPARAARRSAQPARTGGSGGGHAVATVMTDDGRRDYRRIAGTASP